MYHCTVGKFVAVPTFQHNISSKECYRKCFKSRLPNFFAHWQVSGYYSKQELQVQQEFKKFIITHKHDQHSNIAGPTNHPKLHSNIYEFISLSKSVRLSLTSQWKLVVLSFIPESVYARCCPPQEQQHFENGHFQAMRGSTVQNDQYLITAGNISKDYLQIWDQMNTKYW